MSVLGKIEDEDTEWKEYLGNVQWKLGEDIISDPEPEPEPVYEGNVSIISSCIWWLFISIAFTHLNDL